MTASIAALLQPLKDRLAAATPGPWECDGFYDGGVISLSIYPLSNQNPPLASGINRHEDAAFFVNAPTDQAKLIKAIEAVAAIHKPVTLWMTHEDADVSYQTKEDVLAERRDLTEEDLVPFDLCSHCRMIEDSPCEGQCTMEAGYRESLWPCPTVAALTQALGGDTA